MINLNEILDTLNQNLSEIKEYYNIFLKFTASNPIIGGMIGLWGLGVLTFFLNIIPKKIIATIKRYCIITVTFNSQHESFHHLVNWIQVNDKFKNPRTLRATNGAWGHSERTTLSIGLGDHFVFFKLRPMIFTRNILSSDGDRVKEEITISTFGISQDIFKKLLKDITPTKPEQKYVYTFSGSDWVKKQPLPDRSLDSVVLKKGQKERILTFISDFIDNKDWYKLHGISYKTGIMLEGPPGTGKTSLIKALGLHLDKNLCIINCSCVSDKAMSDAFNSLPSDSLVLLEDIDSISATHSRTVDDQDEFGFSTLSGILNAIDGVNSAEGRIMIATTNVIEKLDSALLRPGRFDLTEKLDNADSEMICRKFSMFFPDVELTLNGEYNKISLAELENIALVNKFDGHKAKEELLTKLYN